MTDNLKPMLAKLEPYPSVYQQLTRAASRLQVKTEEKVPSYMILSYHTMQSYNTTGRGQGFVGDVLASGCILSCRVGLHAEQP